MSQSIVKNVKEALVKLFLPELSFGCDADDHKTLIWSRVYINKLALLWLEVRLSCALGILSSLVQLICDSHVHLDLNSGQVDMIILVSDHEILIAIVPEERMRLHLDQLVGGSCCVALGIVLEALQVIKLNRDDAS